MKSCVHCAHAVWEKTKSGKLHPSGDGRCSYPYSVPALPQSMYWIGRTAPAPSGGHINRREELKDHCPYFLRHPPVVPTHYPPKEPNET